MAILVGGAGDVHQNVTFGIKPLHGQQDRRKKVCSDRSLSLSNNTNMSSIVASVALMFIDYRSRIFIWPSMALFVSVYGP